MVKQRRIGTLIALVEMTLGGRLTAVEHAAIHGRAGTVHRPHRATGPRSAVCTTSSDDLAAETDAAFRAAEGRCSRGSCCAGSSRATCPGCSRTSRPLSSTRTPRSWSPTPVRAVRPRRSRRAAHPGVLHRVDPGRHLRSGRSPHAVRGPGRGVAGHDLARVAADVPAVAETVPPLRHQQHRHPAQDGRPGRRRRRRLPGTFPRVFDRRGHREQVHLPRQPPRTGALRATPQPPGSPRGDGAGSCARASSSPTSASTPTWSTASRRPPRGSTTCSRPTTPSLPPTETTRSCTSSTPTNSTASGQSPSRRRQTCDGWLSSTTPTEREP